MKTVVRFSLKQQVLYNLLFMLLIVAGAFALISLPAERYPNVNFGEVVITTLYPGASPTEVENLVTRKIEDALEGVTDIEWITATSHRGRSHVRLKFIDDTDYEALYNEVRFNVLNIQQELPADIDPPITSSITTEDFVPVVVLNLAGEHENRTLALIGEEIKAALIRIPGVQEIIFSGEYIREFHLMLDPGRLKSLGVSFEEVAAALESANVSIPAGDFNDWSGEFVVMVDEKFRQREQVLATVIRKDADGSFVRVKDLVSRAGLGYRKPEVISSVNGRNAFALQVIKSTHGNALEIKEEVDQVIDGFRPRLEQWGIEIVLTQDSTVYIHERLSTLGWNLLLGIILVSLIIWHFMGIRNAGLITIGIPFSFMITMLFMYLTGNSLNEITLFAFVLVAGIIVDDAIVVTENIYRHVQEGRELKEAIVRGTSEVALPVISATLTTAAAFLPMLIMTGATGEFFALIPKAITFALAASLIECLLILPIHYLGFGPRYETKQMNPEKDEWLMKRLRTATEQILKTTLRFRFSSLLAVTALFLSALLILGLSASGKVSFIKIQFFPDDYSVYYVDIEAPSSTPVEQMDETVKTISDFIMADGPGMAASTAGFAGFYINEDYEPVFSNNFGTVLVTMPPKAEQSFDDPLSHLDRMRRRLNAEFGGDQLTLRVHPQKDGPPQGRDLNVRVLGNNAEAINALADELLHFMAENDSFGPYLVDLGDDRGQPKRVFRFEVLQERAKEYGLESTQVARLAASVLDGRYAGKYQLRDDEIDLKLFIDPEILQTPEESLHIPLIEHASGPIHLNDLVRVHAYDEVQDLNRYQGRRAVSLKADIKEGAPTSSPAVISAIKEHYETLRNRYPGVVIGFGGEHEDTQRSYQSLTYAFILAILVMYVILATQFQSYLQPLIILSAIVFALIGVVFGKLVTQSLFTVNSFIAVLGLAGVVVNDALVLIDFINKGYRNGKTRREAITDGVRIRLRPIVLTTLTTTLGLMPMALGIPSYSLVWGAMASTFVTGLATATALTLFIVPVLWDLIEGWREKRGLLKTENSERPAA